MRGLFNIVIGIAVIIGGLSGKFALLGTNSGKALAAVGLIPLGMGLYQMYKAKERRRVD